MVKKVGKHSLAEKISSVLNAAPKTLDPEDQRDETTAKLTTFEDDFNYEDDNFDEEKLLSKFRKQNVDLLADIDEKYAGKRSSRKSLKNETESEVEESEDEQEEEELTESDTSEEIEKIDQPSEDEFESSENDNSEEKNDSNDDSEGESITAFNIEDQNDINFKHIKEANMSIQVSKGIAVRNQMNIWENLLEIRIQLQKMLMAANKMPQKVHYKEIKIVSGSDFINKVEETKDNLTNVLDKMLAYQKLMIKSYPETKKLADVKNNNEGVQNEDVHNEDLDEEIPSDTDEEDSKSASENDEQEGPPLKKKRKLEAIELKLNEFHDNYKQYRNNTIEKWNTKTRLSVSKNNGQTFSVVNQIEHILRDKDKLLKKTQLNRTGFNIVAPQKQDQETSENENDEEYNTDIFDDTDFYHQLLRELIEVKSADVTDPVQLGRQWIQLQNLRSKMKKKVDTKASKGRKIRYAIHTKLVNFMAPFDNYSWTDEAKNELFSSLFGKSQPKAVSAK